MGKELKQKTGEKKTAIETTLDVLMQTADQEPREKRTEHPSLAIEPSVWALFKMLAKSKNTTPNALFCDIIRSAVEMDAKRIEKYKELVAND